MAEYIALIHKEADTGFGASFPDFPGAVTVSETLEGLRVLAEEVLVFHIEGMIEDGLDIPRPTGLDFVTSSEEFKESVAVLAIKAPENIISSVRINITVPSNVLKHIDDYAGQHGMSRSGFLVNAAKRQIELQKTSISSSR